MMTGTLTLLETDEEWRKEQVGTPHPWGHESREVWFEAMPTVGEPFAVHHSLTRYLKTSAVKSVQREGDTVYFRTYNSTYQLDVWSYGDLN